MVFPRTYRLTKPAEFKRVFMKPLVSSDEFFKVLARSNGLAHARVGMAVSRQVDRRAVGRNRIKRVIRESFRNHFVRKGRNLDGPSGTDSPVPGPGENLDIVVLPRHHSASICNRRLYRSLQDHWSRLESRLEG